MQTQIMLVGSTSWEGTREVDAIIEEMEAGIFINSARLWDQILRDARIASTAFTRVYGLLGKPFKMDPSDAKRGDYAQRIADEIKIDWPKMATHDTLAELLLWGIGHGVGLAQVIEFADFWTLEVWHPWALQWREDLRQYVVMTRENAQIFIREDEEGGYVSDGGQRWVLYAPYGFANAHRRGLLRALARLYLERQWVHRDRARYSEVHGQPTLLGTAPGRATDQEVSEYEKRLGDMRSSGVVIARKGETGNQWGLDLVEAKGTSHQLFDETIAQLDKEIATLFLGQSQTTDGQAGLGANEMAGEPVRLDIMKADGDSLANTLRDQFLAPYCEWAYGRRDMAPHPCWHVDPPEDRAKKATQAKDLIAALSQAKGEGIPIDIEAVLEEFGIPVDQEALTAMKAAQKVAQLAALQPSVQPSSGQPGDPDEAAPAIGNTPEKLTMMADAIERLSVFGVDEDDLIRRFGLKVRGV